MFLILKTFQLKDTRDLFSQIYDIIEVLLCDI